jgi:hypothetical protein
VTMVVGRIPTFGLLALTCSSALVFSENPPSGNWRMICFLLGLSSAMFGIIGRDDISYVGSKFTFGHAVLVITIVNVYFAVWMSKTMTTIFRDQIALIAITYGISSWLLSLRRTGTESPALGDSLNRSSNTLPTEPSDR